MSNDTTTTGTTASTISEAEYKRLRAEYDHYHAERARICKSPTVVTVEERALLPKSPTHEEISAIEVYEFVHKPLEEGQTYTAYLDQDGKRIATYNGETLGTLTEWGQLYKSNMGDERLNVTWRGIDGRLYYGTVYGGPGFAGQFRLKKGQ